MVAYPPSFCPQCGTELEASSDPNRTHRRCDSCERVVWHNPVPAAGVAVVDRTGAVLCVERAIPPGVGEWTIPGGHMEIGEQPTEAAVRELEEETGVTVDPTDLEIHDVISLPIREDKQIVSIVYVAERSDAVGEPTGGSDAADARFLRPGAFEGTAKTFRSVHLERFHAISSSVSGSTY